jgi:hypothetical protein
MNMTKAERTDYMKHADDDEDELSDPGFYLHWATHGTEFLATRDPIAMRRFDLARKSYLAQRMFCHRHVIAKSPSMRAGLRKHFMERFDAAAVENGIV